MNADSKLVTEVATILIYAVIYIVGISVLVAVHEFGHFWVARRMGVKVIRFSIGLGKVLWSRPLKDGTEFAISAIPIGGYVSMLGENDDNVSAQDLGRSFKSQPPAKRIAVMAAGPLANFLFAIVAYWILYLFIVPGYKPVVGEVTPHSIAERAGMHRDDVILEVDGKVTPTHEAVVMQLLKGLLDDGVVNLRVSSANGSPREVRLNVADKLSELTEPDALLAGLGFDFWRPPVPTVLASIVSGSPAELAGLRVGDQIVRVDGVSTPTFDRLVMAIEKRADQTVAIDVLRGEKTFAVDVLVGKQTTPDGRTVGRIGVGAGPSGAIPEEMRLPRDSVVGALGRAVEQTYDKTIFVFQSIGYLVQGKVSIKSVSGPIGIANVMGDAAQFGFFPFLSILILISITIGALNLLPIPVLDGGQIVLQLAELLKGRPVSERTQVIAQQVGVALLIMLAVLAFYNDITARVS